MKIVTLAKNASRFGILQNDRVLEVTSLFSGKLDALLQSGDTILQKLAAEAVPPVPTVGLSSVLLHAPVRPETRIFGIGLNYAEHAAESRMQTQSVPTVFLKLASSAVGHKADIILPKNTEKPDYEAELAVVIGKGGYRIHAADWEEHVFGYTILNDVSARDVQLATSQWTLGKSFPTFTPVGPWVVTRDAIPDPHNLDIRLSIDGETLQESNTSLLIFRIPKLIEYISSITPLFPGDIISTGTPPGVGLGRKPERWLRPGEAVSIEIAGIGELVNQTISER